MKNLYKKIAEIFNRVFKQNWTAKKATAYGYKFIQSATSTTITGVIDTANFAGDKIIPNSIDGKPVTSILDAAFVFCSELTSIIIPSSVTSIGRSAFTDCSGITNIVIPSSVTNIGCNAFYDCTELASIISNSPNFRVESQRYLIQNSNNLLIAFAQGGITSAVIPDSVTSIEHYAFYHCTELTSITIPNSVINIGVCAFARCTGLTNIVIPDSVTSIRSMAFCNCTGLANINIPESVTSIGKLAFGYCNRLSSINITNSI